MNDGTQSPNAAKKWHAALAAQFVRIHSNGQTEGGNEMQPGTENGIGSSLPEAISPGIARAQEAFRRDLPELLKNRTATQPWVAYHGNRRIGFGKTKTELFQDCLRQGLRRGEFIVRCIESELPHDIDLSREV
jgi:hypothetical protein